MGEQYEIFDGDEPIDRFEVRDLRVKTRFAIDNRFQDEYAHILGPTCSMVYYSLVRHANKEQKTWPSQKRIAHQVGASREWVGRYIQILAYFNIVRSVRVGRSCTNRYYLVDEKYWRTDYEEMLKEVKAALKPSKKGVEKVMRPQVTSLPGHIRCLERSHQMLLRATSNSKDNQKDNQESRKTVRKVEKKTVDKAESPKTIHVGEGKYKRETYNAEANVIVIEHYG